MSLNNDTKKNFTALPSDIPGDECDMTYLFNYQELL
jgi:hypothetical protein